MSSNEIKDKPSYSSLIQVMKTYVSSDYIGKQLDEIHSSENPKKTIYIDQDDLYDSIKLLEAQRDPILMQGSNNLSAALILEYFVNNPEGFKEVLSTCLDDQLVELSLKDETTPYCYLEGLSMQMNTVHQQIYKHALNARIPSNVSNNSYTSIPKTYLRNYALRFLPGKDAPIMRMRDIKASSIGKLVKVRGIISSSSPVRLMAEAICYTCKNCKSNNYILVNAREYMPPTTCVSETCDNEKNSMLIENPGLSKYIMYQELKLQELSSDTPTGSIPRTITLYITGPDVQSVNAGDICTVTGIFKPVIHGHQASLRLGHNVETIIEVQQIQRDKAHVSGLDAEEIDAQANEVMSSALSGNIDLLDVLSKSLAPEIFGHENVKKALILLLIGAPTKTMKDVKMRGNINLLLCGDPGVAKSQLLKYITNFAPRAIYTSGKGSSAAGLTASVVRDPATKELVLEGGALVLADKGICLLDEFDKLPDEDKTALHEIMEQEKVSVAKAGIVSSLNARCSIIAAANPIEGKYNRQKTMTQNINLPAALLSRFDLVFILCDNVDSSYDRELAKHITNVHMNNKAPVSADVLSPRVSRAIIDKLKVSSPEQIIPQNVQDKLVDVYVSLRNVDSRDPDDDTYTSARSLMTILRLSMASARARMSNTVTEQDVNRAVSLMAASRASIAVSESDGSVVEQVYERTIIDDEGNSLTRRFVQKARSNAKSRENIDAIVFHAVSETLASSDPIWNIDILFGAIAHTGADRQTFDRIIQQYSDYGVFIREDDSVYLVSRAEEL